VHSQTVVIDIPMYMRIAQNNRNFKLKYALLRNNTALLKDWPNDRLFRLAFHFQEKIYTGKRLIVTDVGDIPPGVHIVMEGSVGVSGTFQWQVVWQCNSSPCIDGTLLISPCATTMYSSSPCTLLTMYSTDLSVLYYNVLVRYYNVLVFSLHSVDILISPCSTTM
jgi:hypothetical protein